MYKELDIIWLTIFYIQAFVYDHSTENVGYIRHNIILNISEHFLTLRYSISRRWLDDLVSEDPKVTYNVANNKVIVPLALLSPPYFETGYPE